MVKTLEQEQKISHRVVEVTPEMAGEWLKSNYKKQRRVTQLKVDRYAQDMDTGNWKLTGEPLIFSKSGDLLNGQHRLLAVVQSGCHIEFLIINGIDEEAYSYIDIGKKRSAADVLHSAGVKHASLVASIGSFVINFPRRINGIRDHLRLASNQEILEFSKSCIDETLIDRVIAWKKDLKRIIPAAKIGGLFYLFAQKDVHQAEEFMNQLASGAALSKDNPILLLRNILIQNSLSDSKYNRVTFDALIITAWNYYRLDKKPKTLKWVKGGKEEFPEII